MPEQDKAPTGRDKITKDVKGPKEQPAPDKPGNNDDGVIRQSHLIERFDPGDGLKRDDDGRV